MANLTSAVSEGQVWHDVAAWRHAIDGCGWGKRVGTHLYLHREAVPFDLEAAVRAAEELAGVSHGDLAVVKLDEAKPTLSLLDYPGFFDEAFPALIRAITVDLARATAQVRLHPPTTNQPVLHRKEMLLQSDHPQRGPWSMLTRRAEAAGLFADPAIIGHAWQWQEELRAHGLRVDGHDLVPRRPGDDDDALAVYRHRTALSRTRLSSPMQTLWRHGYLDGGRSVFDYGCGRGDDLALLETMGIESAGWDPWFRPDGELREADVVNIGFVVNVIEATDQRGDALRGAWHLTRQVLAIAALIGGRTAVERWRLLGDGVLTSRNTFQKYFTQSELGAWIEEVLGRTPVSVSPGVYFVFRDDALEQSYLLRRQRSLPIGTEALPVRVRSLKPAREPRIPRSPKAPKAVPRGRLEDHPELVEAFWREVLALGRLPDESEWPRLRDVREHLGLPKRTLDRIVAERGETELLASQGRRRSDLLVYLALEVFERRKSFGSLPETIQADIRAAFGSYARGLDDARQLLFSIARPEVIASACVEAASLGVGWLEPDEGLWLDADLLPQLPAVLRVYAGCAERLYGEAQAADAVKVHVRSGKLTLMTFDDFRGKAVPMLLERVKVDLRRQKIDWFQYGENFPPQPQWLKSRLLHASADGYTEQRAFDDAVAALGGLDFAGHGPSLATFDARLAELGLRVDGMALVGVEELSKRFDEHGSY